MDHNYLVDNLSQLLLGSSYKKLAVNKACSKANTQDKNTLLQYKQSPAKSKYKNPLVTPFGNSMVYEYYKRTLRHFVPNHCVFSYYRGKSIQKIFVSIQMGLGFLFIYFFIYFCDTWIFTVHT